MKITDKMRLDWLQEILYKEKRISFETDPSLFTETGYNGLTIRKAIDSAIKQALREGK